MDKDNQTLRELIRARKQARPNKQNADSSDTDSYENMAEFENLANADSQAKFENFANGDDRAEIDNFSNTDNKTKFDNENLANSDTNTQNFNNQKITNFNNQNLDKNPANSDNPNKNHKISRNYDENPIIIKDYGIAVNYFSIVFTVILGVIGVIFGKMEFRKLSFLIILYLPILKFVFNGYFERKNSHYYFENSKIIHAKNKFNPIQELNLGDIVDFKKTTFYISPYDTEKIKVRKEIIILLAFFAFSIYFIYFVLIQPNEFLYFLFVIGAIGVIAFLPSILFQIFLGDYHSLRLYDTLEIRTKNNEMMKIYIPTQWDYNEVRKYFLFRIGKDIKRVAKFKKII